MNEIEKMKRYIERAKIPVRLSIRYDIRSNEYMALADLDQRSDAVILAFAYGQAKGYRAAKVEAGGHET